MQTKKQGYGRGEQDSKRRRKKLRQYFYGNGRGNTDDGVESGKEDIGQREIRNRRGGKHVYWGGVRSKRERGAGEN
eukprot:748375-Hanusia_phi.AAC.6